MVQNTSPEKALLQAPDEAVVLISQAGKIKSPLFGNYTEIEPL